MALPLPFSGVEVMEVSSTLLFMVSLSALMLAVLSPIVANLELVESLF